MIRHRLRIRFCKQGDLRWIGHRDLVRTLERALRRAGLPLARTQGFHPKPRMNFPLPLALGVEGCDELMEVELTEPLGADEVHRRLGAQLPVGLGLRRVEVVPPGAPKARVRRVTYEVPVPAGCEAQLPERIAELLGASRWMVHRSAGRRPVDVRPLIESLRVEEGTLRMRLRADAGQVAGARDVLAALGLGELETQGICIRRTEVEAQ